MAGTAADEHFDREVRRHYRYNFTVHVIEGGLAWFAFSCAATRTVLPAYLSLLTDSRLLISLPEHLFNASWSISMLFFAYLVQRHHTRKWPCVFYGLSVRLMLVVWGLTALGTARYGRTFGIVGVYAGVLLVMVSAGPSELSWSDLISRIMPQDRRGRFFAAWQCAGVVAGTAAAAMVGMMIDPQGDVRPEQYGRPFLIGAAVFIVSLVFIAITREPVHPDPPRRVHGYWAYLRRAMAVLRDDRLFRRYVGVRMIAGLAGLFGASLFAAYGIQQLGVSRKTISGPLNMVSIISQVAAAPLLGRLADRFGFKLVYVFAVVCGIAASVVGLTLHVWRYPAYGLGVCYALVGVGGAAGFMATFNMTFEFADLHSRSLYIAIAATSSAPVYLAAGACGSALVDLVGFVPMLAAAAVIHTAVCVVVAWRLPEPRRHVRASQGPPPDHL